MTLSTYTIGNGQDLVLLHGWGLHSPIWKEFAQTLAQHFRVTVIDLPGYGESKYDPKTAKSLPKLAEQLLEYAPPQAIWLGWSLGGLIASYLATYYPRRALGLITIASNIKFVACKTWPHAVDESIFTNFNQELTHNAFSTLWRFLSLALLGTENIKQYLRQLRYILQDNQPHQQALTDGLYLLQNTDLRKFLGQLRCPGLAIFGQNDALIPSNAAKQISWQYPLIQTCIIEQAAHIPFLTHPKKTIHHIKQYYDERIKHVAYN